jgi:DNA topoisomerase-1
MTSIKLFDYFLYNQFGGKNSNKKKWTTLNHNGVLFPDPYKPHNVPLIYDGEKIVLDPISEEYATIYAKYIDTEYIKNSKFNRNFFKDWKTFLKKGGFTQIIDFTKCNFSLIQNYLEKHKEKKINQSKEEKEEQKNIKNKLEEKYKTALVDTKEQEVGNFRIEPPGIFLGRGAHPKAGKIKKRIMPEDIVINIGKQEKVPEMPIFYKDHKWHKVIHDNTLEWLASWKDGITGKVKYVWLGAKSDFKAKSDLHKFELARKLKKIIAIIRKNNFNNITANSVDVRTKQLACALYLIDLFALRIGNEKGSDEADTVGVCSLRLEHVELLADNILKLDFLGKDSIRYLNKVKIDENVYKCLVHFIKNKKKNDDLFDQINPSMVNNYIKSMMHDLTTKVFRTYNASQMFQDEINLINKKFEKSNNLSVNDKIKLLVDLYNSANIKVALLCNHQKNVSKTHSDQVNKLDEKIKEITNKKKQLEKEKNDIDKDTDKSKVKKLNEKIKKVQKMLSEIKNKKKFKIELKNLSLSTSKTNYIDPRISVAFFKKHNLPIEKIFSPSLIDKFFWAMDVDASWSF